MQDNSSALMALFRSSAIRVAVESDACKVAMGMTEGRALPVVHVMPHAAVIAGL